MNNVPQFPGKGGAGEAGKPGPTQPLPGWAKAMCPFLTAGEIARQPADTVILTAGAQKPPMTAQSCKGPACMLFVSVRNPDGSETSGCAPVFQFGQMALLNQQVARFMQAAEAGAAAEAARAQAAVPLTDAAPAATEPPKPE